ILIRVRCGLRRLLIKGAKGQRIYTVNHYQKPNKKLVSYNLKATQTSNAIWTLVQLDIYSNDEK
ncbi:MAG: hypothetical protein ACPGNU_04715, partial [Gammaproteobacteria bacterium]